MNYTIAVITDKKPDDDILKEMLAPYDQNIRVEPYIERSYTDVKMEMRRCSDAFGEEEQDLLEALDKNDIGTLRYLNLKYYDNFGLFEDITKDGCAVTSYNPKSKWDSWRVLNNDIDFLGVKQLSQLNSVPRVYETDTEAEIKQKFPSMEKMYKNQLAFDKVFRKDYWEANYPTLFDYICYRIPDAVVHPDGHWDDTGKDGRYSIELRRSVCKRYYEIVDSYPQSYYLTMVQCHI